MYRHQESVIYLIQEEKRISSYFTNKIKKLKPIFTRLHTCTSHNRLTSIKTSYLISTKLFNKIPTVRTRKWEANKIRVRNCYNARRYFPWNIHNLEDEKGGMIYKLIYTERKIEQRLKTGATLGGIFSTVRLLRELKSI